MNKWSDWKATERGEDVEEYEINGELKLTRRLKNNKRDPFLYNHFNFKTPYHWISQNFLFQLIGFSSLIRKIDANSRTLDKTMKMRQARHKTLCAGADGYLRRRLQSRRHHTMESTKFKWTVKHFFSLFFNGISTTNVSKRPEEWSAGTSLITI